MAPLIGHSNTWCGVEVSLPGRERQWVSVVLQSLYRLYSRCFPQSTPSYNINQMRMSSFYSKEARGMSTISNPILWSRK